MAIYEYKCKECGYRFELQQSMSDGKKRKCPKCKLFALVRIIFPPAIHFGPGFPGNDMKKRRESMGEWADNQGEQHQE